MRPARGGPELAAIERTLVHLDGLQCGRPDADRNSQEVDVMGSSQWGASMRPARCGPELVGIRYSPPVAVMLQ